MSLFEAVSTGFVGNFEEFLIIPATRREIDVDANDVEACDIDLFGIFRLTGGILCGLIIAFSACEIALTFAEKTTFKEELAAQDTGLMNI